MSTDARYSHIRPLPSIAELHLEVPVVAVFTKFDAPRTKMYTEFEDEFEDSDESELSEMVDAKMNDLRIHLEMLIHSTAHPPSAHVFLQSAFSTSTKMRR